MTKYHYTYYSYEEFGRGYIGKRSCKCKPEEDVNYFGSYKDKTFKPTQKIILETYDTAEEALADEVELHKFYNVRDNPHFANQVNSGEKFYRTPEEARNDRKRYWDSLSEEEKKLAIERMHSNPGNRERVRERVREMNKNRTPEQKKEIGKKISQKRKEYLKGLSKKELKKLTEKARNGKSQNPKNSQNFQRAAKDAFWKCTVTGYISSASSVTYYQKARGIDTSNRVRIA